jgi:hypothetical protein
MSAAGTSTISNRNFWNRIVVGAAVLVDAVRNVATETSGNEVGFDCSRGRCCRLVGPWAFTPGGSCTVRLPEILLKVTFTDY